MPEITGIPLFLYPEIHSGHAMISLESHDDFTRVTGVFDTGQNTTSLGWVSGMTGVGDFMGSNSYELGSFYSTVTSPFSPMEIVMVVPVAGFSGRSTSVSLPFTLATQLVKVAVTPSGITI